MYFKESSKTIYNCYQLFIAVFLLLFFPVFQLYLLKFKSINSWLKENCLAKAESAADMQNTNALAV